MSTLPDRFTFERERRGIRLSWDRHYKPVLKYVGLVLLLCWVMLPVYFVFAMSLKDDALIRAEMVGIPFLTFQPAECGVGLAWCSTLISGDFMNFTLATLVVATGTAGLATVAAVFAAYAFARLEFPWKNGLFVLSVGGFMFPVVLLTIPIFVVLHRVELVNTFVGMILAFTAFTLPYNIWLLRGFFEDLPDNLEEAARVDGCTQVGSFFRVILPLARPAIASVFLLAFLLAWHNYVMAAVLAMDKRHLTLSPGLFDIGEGFSVTSFNDSMVAIFLTMLVPVLMYMYLQQYLIEGLTAGAGTKG